MVTRYVPSSWRKVLFIPKPGRESYPLAKSFRLMNLSSFLVKTLENMIENYITDDALRANPLHRNQCAYQMDKFCWLVIDELTNKAEKAIGEKEILLVIFLDIEGARSAYR